MPSGGPRPNSGGARPGAGRKKGDVNKAKKILSEMAKEYAPAALRTLAEICAQGESEQARVSAANAILDRAYGKPPQALEHTGADGGPIQTEAIDRDADEFAGRIARLAAARTTPTGDGEA